MPKEINLKIILVGDPAVGKTSLVLNYVKKIFKTNYLPTLGVDIYNKELKINENKINLVVWDIAGQKGWEMMHKSYYRGSEGVLAVFDLTKKETLTNLGNWIDEVLKYTDKNIPIIILGNKKDLKLSKEVTDKKINNLMKKGNYIFMETSAKTGENVDVAFNELIRKFY